jgi:hypothetical protein
MNDKNPYLSSFLAAYFVAVLSMLAIFYTTMKVHYSELDLNYLRYALGHMVWLAVPAGVLGAIMHKKHLLTKVIISMIVGPLSAAVFIWLK